MVMVRAIIEQIYQLRPSRFKREQKDKPQETHWCKNCDDERLNNCIEHVADEVDDIGRFQSVQEAHRGLLWIRGVIWYRHDG